MLPSQLMEVLARISPLSTLNDAHIRPFRCPAHGSFAASASLSVQFSQLTSPYPISTGGSGNSNTVLQREP